MAFVGIDLGTTTSEIAIFDAKEGPRLLKDARGHAIVDSYFGFDRKTNKPVVGESVKSIAQSDPDLVVEQVKRYMREDVEFTLGEHRFTPAEISAQILTHLKESAEQQLGEPVTRCVITVPANFPDPARRATQQAGEIAGMTVERIINEPTAAALAYGYDEDLDGETILVYDFGGGTFDVSIVEYRGTMVEVKASSGNTDLGGKDFDRALVQHVTEKFEAEHGIEVVRDSGNYYRLLFACEAVKKDLSVSTHATVNIPYFMVRDGSPINLQVDVRRNTFESLIHPLVEQTEAAIEKALADANLNRSDINRVLMVGGTSRIPYVQQFVERLMGVAPHKQIDPDKVIAMGAAVQTAIIDGLTDRTIQDVCPLSLGTVVVRNHYGQMVDGQYSEIIPTNSKVSQEHTREYTPAAQGQSSVTLHVYQRDSQSGSVQAEINEEPNTEEGFTRLAERTIDIPEAADTNDIEVTYVYNPNGMLDISVTFPGTDTEHTFQAHAGLDDEAIARSRRKVQASRGAAPSSASSNASSSTDSFSWPAPDSAASAQASDGSNPARSSANSSPTARSQRERSEPDSQRTPSPSGGPTTKSFSTSSGDMEWDNVDWLKDVDASSSGDASDSSKPASSSSPQGAPPEASWKNAPHFSDVKSLIDIAESALDQGRMSPQESSHLRDRLNQLKHALADNDSERVYQLEAEIMDIVLGV